MPSSLEDINVQIIRLKKLKFDFAHQKGILDVIGAELDEVKQTILDELKAAKALSYKTETGTVSINRRQTVKITDEDALTLYLTEAGIEVPTKLDATRLKPTLEQAVFQDGLVVDGTEVSTNEYISLREPTAKKETA